MANETPPADANIFVTQPEFIADDPRTDRPEVLGYKIDANFMFRRHQILLPKKVVENKSVLDLGSCHGATGAWCLSQGAKFYRGVELQDEFVRPSVKNLSKYYDRSRWEIEHKSVEDFFAGNTSTFDIVVASGVLHAFSDVVAIVEKIAGTGNLVVIDAEHPRTIKASGFLSDQTKARFTASREYAKFIENEPFIALQRTGMSLADRKTVLFHGFIPSMGALKSLIVRSGFGYIPSVNQALKKYIPDVYSPLGRFGLAFLKKTGGKSVAVGLTESMKSPAASKVVSWEEF